MVIAVLRWFLQYRSLSCGGSEQRETVSDYADIKRRSPTPGGEAQYCGVKGRVQLCSPLADQLGRQTTTTEGEF